MPQVSTPCVKLCIVDIPSGLCQGCGRTLDEIGAWSVLQDSERLTIMRALPERLTQSRAARMAAAGRANGRRARLAQDRD